MTRLQLDVCGGKTIHDILVNRETAKAPDRSYDPWFTKPLPKPFHEAYQERMHFMNSE